MGAGTGTSGSNGHSALDRLLDDGLEPSYPSGSAAAFAAFERMTAEELLSHIANQFSRVAIACSMQKESSVMLDLATTIAPDRFEVFTLDTGVLFEETRSTWLD